MKSIIYLSYFMFFSTIIWAQVDTLKVMPSSKIDESEDILWETYGGFRFGYMRLTGGFEGDSYEGNQYYKVDYNEIGMDNYAPTFNGTFGGRYKYFNLFLSAGGGEYTGSFVTQQDMIKDDILIPKGSNVDGSVKRKVFSLATTINILRGKHKLGAGLGMLFLDYTTNYKVRETDDSFGMDMLLPMPFLALSGQLNFDRWKFVGSGGGAFFSGEVDGNDFLVGYYTIDLQAGYQFIQQNHLSAEVFLGFRNLFMKAESSDEEYWFKSKDTYSGPFAGIVVKFTTLKE